VPRNCPSSDALKAHEEMEVNEFSPVQIARHTYLGTPYRTYYLPNVRRITCRYFRLQTLSQRASAALRYPSSPSTTLSWEVALLVKGTCQYRSIASTSRYNGAAAGQVQPTVQQEGKTGLTKLAVSLALVPLL
jgi:hypothetical protein